MQRMVKEVFRGQLKSLYMDNKCAFNYSFMIVYITVVNPVQGILVYLVIQVMEGQSLRITWGQEFPWSLVFL